MRLPIPVVIPTILITVVTALYLTTRNRDFSTPPTPKKLGEIKQEWKEVNTPQAISQEKAAENKKLALAQAKAQASKATKPTPPPAPPAIPLGDLGRAPRLSEYGSFGNQGTASMIQLAQELEKKEAQQRALLAWERVLDTSTPSKNEVKQAGQAIQTLKPLLPPWNPDPNSDITITLHAGANTTEEEALKQALQKTADLISEASGYIITVKTQLTIAKGKAANTPRTPIAIWFSHTPKEKETKTAETPPLSFLADPSQETMLANQFQAAVYALLSNHLTKHTSYSKLPEYPAGVTPEELLKFYVTRLMWREFSNTLK